MLNYGMRSRLAIAFSLRLSHMDAGDEATYCGWRYWKHMETYYPHMAYKGHQNTRFVCEPFTFKMSSVYPFLCGCCVSWPGRTWWHVHFAMVGTYMRFAYLRYFTIDHDSMTFMLRYIVYDVARLGEAGKIEPHTDNQSQAPSSVGWVWVKLTNVNWSNCTSHAMIFQVYCCRASACCDRWPLWSSCLMSVTSAVASIILSLASMAE